jgi:hypothetical protein
VIQQGVTICHRNGVIAQTDFASRGVVRCDQQEVAIGALRGSTLSVQQRSRERFWFKNPGPK